MAFFSIIWGAALALVVIASLGRSSLAPFSATGDRTGSRLSVGWQAALAGTRRALAIAGLGFLVWGTFAVVTPLVFDEAYYWQWSRHPAWGYYDHPPMIAFLIGLGTLGLGDTVAGVRLVPLIMGMSAIWLIHGLARRYWGSEGAAHWALAVSLLIPLFALGLTLATPDTPLLFFWALSLVLTIRALDNQQPADWVFAGLAVGLGLMSKLSMVLIYPALLLALLHTASGRQALRRAGPYLAVGVSLIASLPFWIWQFRHGGSGLVFQLRHGLTHGGPQAPELKGLTGLLASQAGLVTPLLFILLVIAVGRAVRALWTKPPQIGESPAATRGDPELLPFLAYPLAVPLVVFGAASFLAKSGPNWMAPAYVTGMVLLGGEVARQGSAASSWRRGFTWAGVGMAASLSLFAHVTALAPLAPLEENRVLTRTWGHADMAGWVAEKKAVAAEGRPIRILASDYKLASLLAFYLPDRPQTCSPLEEGSGSAYRVWQSRLGARTRGLYISSGPEKTQNLSRIFSDWAKLGERAIYRKGVRIRFLWAYEGTLKPGVCGREPTS